MTHLTAAYMAIGLITAPNQLHVQDHWGNGQLELLGILTSYADYSWALADAAFKFCDGSPGVVQYEVDEEFGAWFGEMVLAHQSGHEPSRETCCEQLRIMMFGFFLKVFSEPTNGQLIDLGACLGAVPLPKPYGATA